MDRNQQERITRAKNRLLLWKYPSQTLYLFLEELLFLLKQWLEKLWIHRRLFFLSIIMMTIAVTIGENYFPPMKKPLEWSFYWLFLGVLSSIGLGTGLPTFILFLGPFIAKVTLAAQECGTVDFPSPPYPDDVVCPTSSTQEHPVTIWTVLKKVHKESMLWGAGTAIGELPPYFLARSSRMAQDNISYNEEEESPGYRKIKKVFEGIIVRIGFFGILLLASVPNPLFDLAGIVCGHFLVPFWIFFGATLIGKAVIKIQIQELFVIAAFNKTFTEKVLTFIEDNIPFIGANVQHSLQSFLDAQKMKLHHDNSKIHKSGHGYTWLSFVLDKMMLCAVTYFIVSIINSMAFKCYKRKKIQTLLTSRRI